MRARHPRGLPAPRNAPQAHIDDLNIMFHENEINGARAGLPV
jgi:hypothetical protein